jgi:enoyl-CoA hydratase/carnithine racemase
LALRSRAGRDPSLPADRDVSGIASAYARHLDQEIAETEDGAEGARAFKEKRPPVWKLR